MAVLIREPPRDDGPTRRVSLRASVDELDVSAIARKSGRRRAPPGGGLLERGFHRGDHGVRRREFAASRRRVRASARA